MLSWLSRSVPFTGSAFFRGTWPLRKENFDHLRSFGVEISDAPAAENAHWALNLRHSAWGEATLASFREIPFPPHLLIEWDSNLIPGEVESIKACRTSVQLMMDSKKNNILGDRKSALNYLNAILGEEGIAALDHVGQKFWSREALQIESSHNADLDVDGIMSLHIIAESESEVIWLHSHGLAEIGSFDFDVLHPSEDLQTIGYDLLRCIAFHIVEGQVKPGGCFSPLTNQPEIRAVPAAEFMAKASAEFTALREDPDGSHLENRWVFCEAKIGGFKSLFSSKPEPAKVLSQPFDEGSLIAFTKDASDLMEQRAKATFSLFMSVADEVAEFDGKPLVKLAYKVDEGDANDREHLWFEFHGMRGEQLDATLLNAPFNIASMKEGQRALHSFDLLSDWAIFTPVGRISPRESKALRFLRQNKEQIRQAIQNPQPD